MHGSGEDSRMLSRPVLGRFGDWLDELPRGIVVVACLLAILLVAVGDVAIGTEVDISIFYVGPVVLCTWLVSEWAGLIVALVAAFLWSALGPGNQQYAVSLIPFWNLSVRVAFLLVTVFLVNLAKEAIKAERGASHTDPMTGVANTRAFQDRARLALDEMRRSRKPLTFCYLDLDHFKLVNDTLGHREGDELLMVLATALKTRLRATDMVARLGGDEFGLLLPDTDFDEAEQVLAAVSAALGEAVAERWPVTVTCGAVTFLQPPSGTDQMVNIADALMYQTKNDGRGRTEHVVWPPENVAQVGWQGCRSELPGGPV